MTKQNNRWRLSDRDETINHIISKCDKLLQKEYKTRHDWVGIVIQEGEIWPYEQMVCAQTRIRLEKLNTHTSLLFWNTNRSPNLGPMIRHNDCQKKKKKRTCRIVNFDVPADHRVKLNESTTREKFLDLACELKNKQLWNMNMTVIPTVIAALGIVMGLKDMDIRGWVETIQTTALLRSARIQKRVLETYSRVTRSLPFQ